MNRFAACAVLVAASASWCLGSLVEGLSGYWRFDGSGVDSSGQGRHLDLVGSPGFVTGLLGQSISFPGDNNVYAVRPRNDPGLHFDSGNFTIQAWVRYDSLEGEQVLIEKWEGMGGPGWTLTKLASHQFRFHLNEWEYLDTSVPFLAVQEWHHVVVVRKDSTIEAYFDLMPVGSIQVGASSNTVTDHPLLIGRRDSDDPRQFPMRGQVDEVAIWRRALSYQEVELLNNQGQGQAISGWILGKVDLTDFVGDLASREITLELVPVMGGNPVVFEHVALEFDGHFGVPYDVAGTYHAYVKSRHFLKRRADGVVDTTGEAPGTLEVSLVNGDVDDDNAVTVFDYNALSEAFDASEGDSRWNPDADLDGDGSVTVFDYNILSQNFDMVGD